MITQIRPRELAQWLATASAHGKPVVLDVREPHELAIARIASITPADFDLLTIPMGAIPARLGELDIARPIACLCHHGGRSMQVAMFLQSRGYDHLANIAGGIHAWSAELDTSIATY